MIRMITMMKNNDDSNNNDNNKNENNKIMTIMITRH
jgi:hypothetical protein